MAKPDSVYVLDLIKVTPVVKRQTIILQWSISVTLESHFKSYARKSHMALVLGTRNSHLIEMFNPLLSLFPLACVGVETVMY